MRRPSDRARRWRTRMQGLRAAVLPQARRRVSWVDALPVAVFTVAAAGACLLLQVRHIVVFTRPSAFAAAALIPWIGWMQLAGGAGLRRTRAVASLLVRLTLFGLLVAALAEPRAVRRNRNLSLMYALDVSDSMGDAVTDQSLAYILKTASAKPEKDQAGLVVLARDAAVELPPRQSFPFEVINARVARDGTDLAQGLSLAGAMVPEGVPGRVVLISDGVETAGRVGRALDDLAARRIPVDVLPVQYAYPDEVWVERIDLPRVVKAGETYEAGVLLSSLRAGTGHLVLRENGRVVARQPVDYEAGKNRFTLPLYLREPGYYEYEAAIEPADGRDGWRENNTALGFVHLAGEGKVLLVTDPRADGRDWNALVDALRQARRQVDVRSAYEVPSDALALLPYDAIVFANAPADAFDAAQLQAVRDAVYQHGAGLLMIGGQNSFGPGGFHRTPIEDALPVSMDITQKKVMPKGALAIVLHTCEFPEGNVWAKRIAKEAIRVLGARDEVGVLIYDGNDRWVFPLTPAGEYERLAQLINRCEPMDMPSFAGIMAMGLTALQASDAAMKHMIIISDGDPSPPTPALVQNFVAAGVSVSTVIINPHGGQDVSIMQALSATTGGRYYFVDDPAALPSIFVKEAKTLKRSMVQNRTFTPAVAFPSPVLKGIETMPELKGYVLTSPKPRSTVVLKGPETDEVDPVLSLWRYGLGRSAAFTSDLGPNWAAAWLQWPQFQAFVQQLFTDLSRVQQKSDLTLQAFADGNEGVLLVDDASPLQAMLDVDAQVAGPRDRTETLRLRQVGPRRYAARFPLWGKGRYRVVALGSGAGRTEQAIAGFALAYSPEYLRFRSNPILLREVAARTGGRVLTGQETGQELFVPPARPGETSRAVFDTLLALLACLVPLDVAIRRVQLDPSVVRNWLRGRRRGADSTPTLSALLRRKESVRAATDAPRLSQVQPTGPAPVGRRSPNASPSPAAAVHERAPTARPPAASDEEPLSTTARLLARKRRRQDGEETT